MVMKIETASHAGLTLLPWPCLESQEERGIHYAAMQNRPRPCNGVTSLNLEEIRIALWGTRLEASIGFLALLDGRQ